MATKKSQPTNTFSTAEATAIAHEVFEKLVSHLQKSSTELNRGIQNLHLNKEHARMSTSNSEEWSEEMNSTLNQIEGLKTQGNEIVALLNRLQGMLAGNTKINYFYLEEVTTKPTAKKYVVLLLQNELKVHIPLMHIVGERIVFLMTPKSPVLKRLHNQKAGTILENIFNTKKVKLLLAAA